MSAQAQGATWKTVESGPPDPMKFLHPLAVKNYGRWK